MRRHTATMLEYHRTREGLVESVLELLAQLDGERRRRVTRLWELVEPDRREAVLLDEVSVSGLRRLRHRADAELRAQRGG